MWDVLWLSGFEGSSLRDLDGQTCSLVFVFCFLGTVSE